MIRPPTALERIYANHVFWYNQSKNFKIVAKKISSFCRFLWNLYKNGARKLIEKSQKPNRRKQQPPQLITLDSHYHRSEDPLLHLLSNIKNKIELDDEGPLQHFQGDPNKLFSLHFPLATEDDLRM